MFSDRRPAVEQLCLRYSCLDHVASESKDSFVAVEEGWLWFEVTGIKLTNAVLPNMGILQLERGV